MVLALNIVSGQIADVSPKLLEHPHFKDILVVATEEDIATVNAPVKKTSKKKSVSKPKAKVVEEIIEDNTFDEAPADNVIESIEIEEEN